MSGLFLVTEGAFHASYLVAKWLGTEESDRVSGHVLVREEANLALLKDRHAFHSAHAGQRDLDAPEMNRLRSLYPELSSTEEAMIRAFGVPALPSSVPDGVRQVGLDLNSERLRSWLGHTASTDGKPFLFVFLDQILAPWWIDRTEGRVVNAHSAVLPFARGMYAIEQVAAMGDEERFEKAAGATLHYVDHGVDTGPVIRAQRLRDPFSYESIWHCKGASFMTAYDLLTDLARSLAGRSDGVPVGIDLSHLGGTDFKRAAFDEERRLAAESGYLRFKKNRS